jgi:glycerol-3-phosphate dehydrogenase (NAD(P)+)
MGGNELSAYGLCHLGDYEATVFSRFSHNRAYGEALVRGEGFTKLAEGHYTAKAIVELAKRYGVDMPICRCVYGIIYEGIDVSEGLAELFGRSTKSEFYK